MASSLQNRRIQIAGNVAKGTTTWIPEKFALAFSLTDGTHSIPVKYKGVRPDNFTDDAQVIAEGKLQADGVFVADKLLMQCPSKYEAKTESPKNPTGSLLETGGGGTP
jgi:cytochrome c-type biogenesis protein CcmE